MFIKLSLSRNADVLLRYHERKVEKGEATLIHSRNFLHPTDRLAYPDMQWRFKALNDLNPRTKVNMVNVIFSFPEGPIPSEDTMAAISDRYMKGMDLEDQPYLVYRHDDTKHPHLHLLGNLIDSNGKRSEVYLNVMQRREHLRKELSQEFNLISVKSAAQSYEKSGEAEKLIYGEANLGQGMAKIIEEAMHDYSFTCIQEYNAILREHNIWAQRVQSEKWGNRVALIYQTVHEDGHKIGKPFPASYFEFKPTWKNLEGRFMENASLRDESCKDLGNRVNWVLCNQPEDLGELCTNLRKRRIEAIVVPGRQGGRNELVLVDHHSRIAVKASDLDIDHELLKVTEELDRLMMGRSKGKAIPQSVTDLLKREKGLSDSEQHKDLSMRGVHKIHRHA